MFEDLTINERFEFFSSFESLSTENGNCINRTAKSKWWGTGIEKALYFEKMITPEPSLSAVTLLGAFPESNK
jgi:hypothetical protein